MNKRVDKLITITSLFSDISLNITRQQFNDFTTPILIQEPDLQSLNWAPLITNSQRSYYEQRAVTEQNVTHGFKDVVFVGPGFITVPSVNASQYVPIFYVNPFKGNEAPFLVNLLSNPSLVPVLNKTRTIKRPSASEPFTLLQETGQQFGFIIFNAVFNEGVFSGYTELVHRTGDLLTQSLSDNSVDDVVVILEKGDTIISVVVSKNNKWNVVLEIPETKFCVSTPLIIADVVWNFRSCARKKYFEKQRASTPLVFLIVTLLSAFIQVVGYIFVMLKIIQHQKSIAEKKTIEELAKKEKEIKFTFINYLFHEIRVPFNTVYSVIQTLLSSDDQPEQRTQLLNMAKVASRQAIDVLSNVLDLEKMEKQLFELNRSWFTVEEFVTILFWSYQRMANEKDIEMTMEIEPDLCDLHVYGDIGRLRHCLVTICPMQSSSPIRKGALI